MEQSSRIKPPMGPDNGWWWQEVANDVLPIQRCKNCQVLRHPPRPMCDQCRSMEWDFVRAGGGGAVFSYTVLEHPQFPGYSYPIIIVLVDLEEGTRITAELVDCDPGEVEFGMAVTVRIQEDSDGFKLPVFYPVIAQEGE